MATLKNTAPQKTPPENAAPGNAAARNAAAGSATGPKNAARRNTPPQNTPLENATSRNAAPGSPARPKNGTPEKSATAKNAEKDATPQVLRYAEMFAAMGNESRLRIVQLLLIGHPEGLVAGEIQEELGIPNSTLSHHLEKLKAENLVSARRDGTFLHYTANTEALAELLQFLYAECCTRNKELKLGEIVQICR